jgi:hypothetical protein
MRPICEPTDIELAVEGLNHSDVFLTKLVKTTCQPSTMASVKQQS